MNIKHNYKNDPAYYQLAYEKDFNTAKAIKNGYNIRGDKAVIIKTGFGYTVFVKPKSITLKEKQARSKIQCSYNSFFKSRNRRKSRN